MTSLSRPVRAATLATCLGLSIVGCGPEPRTRGTMPLGGPPPALLPISALGADVMLEQHVTARYQDREDGFDAVLQRRGDTLTLVGLGPMGSVGFVVTATDAEGVTLQNDSGHDVPFEPAHIVADVQRVFYPWLTGTPPTDGLREGDALELHVVEQYASGLLVERRFTMPGAPERGAIVVRYEGWDLGAVAPSSAVLDNAWYGYVLTIETSSARVLAAEPASEP